MRIAAYCRVSTEKEQQLESLQNQIDFFNDFAKKHNHELVNIYADEGISGKQKENRVQFMRMLEDSKKYLFDMVVVKDISRFARNTVDFLTAIRELKGRGIDVQFLSSNQTILGNSEFILTVFSAMAQEESANLSSRVKFGKKVNARKGRVPNIIYGYDKIDTFTLTVNDCEAEVVRKIFDMYCNEGLGTRKISNALNDAKIPSKKGLKWSPKSIGRLLENPIYKGTLINNKVETVDYLTGKKRALFECENFVHNRPELRIISDEMFDKAMEQLSKRKKVYSETNRRYSNIHKFSTLIKCLDCGYSFTRKVYNYKNTYIRWRCSGNNLHSSSFCKNNIVIDEDELFNIIADYFICSVGDKQSFIDSLFKDYKEKCKNQLRDVNELQKQIEKNKFLIEKYKQMFANNLIDMIELKEKINDINEKISELKAKTAEEKYRQGNIDKIIIKEQNEAYDIRRLITAEVIKNSDMRKLIDKITVSYTGEVTVYTNSNIT